MIPRLLPRFLIAAAIGLAGCHAPARSGPPVVTGQSSTGLSLTMNSGSEALQLFNPELNDIDVASGVTLEQLGADGQWHSLGVALYAGAGCVTATVQPVAHLPARAVVEARPCMGMPAHGPGSFRYVVTLVPSQARVTGPVFRLPG